MREIEKLAARIGATLDSADAAPEDALVALMKVADAIRENRIKRDVIRWLSEEADSLRADVDTLLNEDAERRKHD